MYLGSFPTSTSCLTHAPSVFLCSQSTPLPQAGLIVLALPISIVAAYGHLPMLQTDTTPLKMVPLSSLHSTTPTTLYHTQTLQLLFIASTSVECICCIYCCRLYSICCIHCCGIYMQHPEYVCCIDCCGIYMLHPLWWNIYAASTAVECICCIHCRGHLYM